MSWGVRQFVISSSSETAGALLMVASVDGHGEWMILRVSRSASWEVEKPAQLGLQLVTMVDNGYWVVSGVCDQFVITAGLPTGSLTQRSGRIGATLYSGVEPWIGPSMPNENESAADVSREIAEAILPDRPDDAGELARLLRSPTARVLLPPDHELAVRLVHVQTIDRLFELQSDSDLYRNGLLIAIGALIGFFTNVVTSEAFAWTTPSIVFVALGLAAVATFGALATRYARRVRALRAEIKGGDGNDDGE